MTTNNSANYSPTQFSVQTGSTNGQLNNVSPSATSGVPLISQGSSSQPIFGTALVAGGGTGSASFSINGAVFSNTTTTGSLQAATLSSGQLLIGGTATPAAATLTAGTGISIVNGNNSITINANSGGFVWNDQSGSFGAVAENGYFITGTSTATLPASPSQGTTISFIVDTTNILTITANTGQTIRVGSAISASGGTCANNARGDAINLVYRVADTSWIARDVLSTWTVT